MRRSLSLSCLCAVALLSACASNDVYPEDQLVIERPGPSAAVREANSPPPVTPLSREEVKRIAAEKSTEDAIRELDASPLDFELSLETIAELRAEGVPSEVVDYLEARSAVNWEMIHANELPLEAIPPEPRQGVYLPKDVTFEEPETESFVIDNLQIHVVGYERRPFPTPISRGLYRLDTGPGTPYTYRTRRVYSTPRTRITGYPGYGTNRRVVSRRGRRR